MSKMSLRYCALFACLTASSGALAQTDPTTAEAKPEAEAGTSAALEFSTDTDTGADASVVEAEAKATSDSAKPTATSTPATNESPATAAPAANAMPDAKASAPDPKRAPRTKGSSWMGRHLPVNGMFELGTGLGLLFPSSKHNLQLERLPQQEINDAGELFVRVAWLPLKYAGIEGEGVVGATTTFDGVQSYPWSMRAQVLGQLPLWRITPLVVLGFGKFGNVSNQMGADSDPLIHVGAGAKFFVSDDFLLRLDLRDNLTQKNDASDGSLTHSPELMLAISLTLGRTDKESSEGKLCKPEDTDGDGIVDRVDQCPNQAGTGRNGCPVADTDGDRILDEADRCVDVPGAAPDGCPPDGDADGVVDHDDQCPTVPGPTPSGCPVPKEVEKNADRDGDGIPDAQDKCPDGPETKNGYEDDDGCPDVLPDEIKQFTSAIQGITFEHNKANIRPTSKPALDKVAGLLAQYRTLRVSISGHTDNTGTREMNLELSRQRAEAVKKYLVEQGIDAGRIETRGVGQDEPVDSNDTEAGREHNRRIEFKVITGS